MRKKERLEKLDIVISIFNQEKLIERVLGGVIKNTITPFRFILIFDGCTDNTQKVAENFLAKRKKKKDIGLLQDVIVRVTPNLYETKANNVGFKLVETPYFITIQDDMVIAEYAWEKRLTYPLRRFDDIFAVTSRGAQDLLPSDGFVERYTYTADRQFGLKRNIFAVRDVINRGPVAFKTECLKKLDFLNESYAPCNLDDADLCLRAWKKYGWRAGVLWINYISKSSWGKARAKDSTMNVNSSNQKNIWRLYSDHHDYIESGAKHSIDYRIEDRDIAAHDGFALSIPHQASVKKLITKTLRILGLKKPILIALVKSKKVYTRLVGKDRHTPVNYALVHYIDLLESGYISRERFTFLVEEYFKTSVGVIGNQFTLIGFSLLIKKFFKKIVKVCVNTIRYTVKTIIRDGPFTGLRKILSQLFRELQSGAPWIAYHALRIAYVFYKTPEDQELIERESRERWWYQNNGDKTLRLEYPLTEHSIVLDIGGFKGNWASDISNMYGCVIYVFEPVKEFAFEIKKRFAHNPKIHIQAAGLGTETKTQKIYLEHGSTSLVRKFKQSTEVDIIDIHEFIKTLHRPIDLVKINIEGAEYDLLEYLIKTGDISLLVNLQIQFHTFVPDAEERRRKIQELLSKTHIQTYNYDFVWESWHKK